MPIFIFCPPKWGHCTTTPGSAFLCLMLSSFNQHQISKSCHCLWSRNRKANKTSNFAFLQTNSRNIFLYSIVSSNFEDRERGVRNSSKSQMHFLSLFHKCCDNFDIFNMTCSDYNFIYDCQWVSINMLISFQYNQVPCRQEY